MHAGTGRSLPLLGKRHATDPGSFPFIYLRSKGEGMVQKSRARSSFVCSFGEQEGCVWIWLTPLPLAKSKKSRGGRKIRDKRGGTDSLNIKFNKVKVKVINKSNYNIQQEPNLSLTQQTLYKSIKKKKKKKRVRSSMVAWYTATVQIKWAIITDGVGRSGGDGCLSLSPSTNTTRKPQHKGSCSSASCSRE